MSANDNYEGYGMKVPDKYEPKTADEFGVFDAAMDRLLAVPYTELQRRLVLDKKKKAKAKKRRSKKTASLVSDAYV
ncbi:MAG TPA: hypothetical protein VG759_08060 [Candidatus Angelobacter sp.]|nr:hypothetical protein [Candidatus Angelobacter sp.]